MDEKTIASFWESHPCGEQFVGGLKQKQYEEFFRRYDDFRYSKEGHILRRLDAIEFNGMRTLEIGLGQGADSEQIIRRGAIWSGLDLTMESVVRVKTRLAIRDLSFKDIKCGSVLNIPYADNEFDIVFSHGVLHHVPEILRAQQEIARVLKPNAHLIVMLYSKYSLNYFFSIGLVRRLGLLGLYFLNIDLGGIYGQHLKNAKKKGITKYLRLKEFIHYNTDGPLNPYSKVYDTSDVKKDFPDFRIISNHKEFMHAPPLPVAGKPGAKALGWHLWVCMTPK